MNPKHTVDLRRDFFAQKTKPKIIWVTKTMKKRTTYTKSTSTDQTKAMDSRCLNTIT